MIGREDAIRILEEGYASTRSLMGRLDDDTFSRRGTIGGGEWSAKDLLCHLMFWESNALEALEDWRSGQEWRRTGAFDEPGGDDRLNADAEAEFRDLPPDGARRRAAATHVALVSAIHDMTDGEWAQPVHGEDASRGEGLGDILQGPDGAAFTHAWAHLEDLRAYAG